MLALANKRQQKNWSKIVAVLQCGKLLNSAVIVTAHPDDEVIGLGTVLPHFRALKAIIHITDGAPRKGSDVENAGLKTWEEYAALRRNELGKVLDTAGMRDCRTICFGCPDQQATFRIAQNAFRLASLFQRLRAQVVFTHPYEGGHPDHDATAAAVHCAVSLLKKRGQVWPAILEFSSYHANGPGMESECFLKNAAVPVLERPLTPAQREIKRKLFACYRSQSNVLAQFALQREPVRVAPAYCFAKPPHRGTLFYERFDWGVKGREWRRRTAQVVRKLNLASYL